MNNPGGKTLDILQGQSSIVSVASVVENWSLIVLALLSYFLYYIKNHTQFFYGCSELLVGAATCWLGVAEKTKENLAATLALIGGISILIRGWVNVCEGYEQPLNMLRSLTTLGASTHKLDGDNGGSIGRMLGIFAYPPEKVYFSILQRTLA
jgi:hypothetical protein